MNNKYVWIRNLAILFIACNLLFWFFPFPPVIWRFLLVTLSLITLLNTGKLLACEKMVLLFAAFNLLHFFVSYLWQSPSASSIGNVLCGSLALTLFSVLSEKGVMTEKAVSVIGIILVIASIVCYNYYGVLLINKSETDTTTNSYSEFFLMLLPLLFFIKKPVIKWLLLLICLFFLIIGAKRGNILAAFIPLVIILRQSLKDSKRSAIKIILTIVLIAGTGFLAYYWTSSNEYLLYRIEQTNEGDSSGRDIIYETTWNLWYYSESVFSQLFGFGYDSVVNKINVAAHSDWLEILVDYGLVGVLLYLVVYLRFVRQIRFTKDPELKVVIISAVSILFIKSFYSMSFNTSTLPLLMISFGTALGRYKTSTAT